MFVFKESFDEHVFLTVTVERTALEKKHSVTVEVAVKPADQQAAITEAAISRPGKKTPVEQAAVLGILQECQRGTKALRIIRNIVFESSICNSCVNLFQPLNCIKS